MPTTTQQSIFPIHLTLKTPEKNTACRQTTVDSETFSFSKIFINGYQTFRPVTTSKQTNKQKTSIRNKFPDQTKFPDFSKNPKQQNFTKQIVKNNHKIKMYHNKFLNHGSLMISHELH